MQKEATVTGECSQYKGEGDHCKLSLWSFMSDEKIKGGDREDKSEIESDIDDQIDADDSCFNRSHKPFQATSLNLELSMALPLPTTTTTVYDRSN